MNGKKLATFWRYNASIVLLASSVGLALLLIGGPGTRFGLWEFPAAFVLMRYAFLIGAIAGVVALLDILAALFMGQRQVVGRLALALVLAGVTVGAIHKFRSDAGKIVPIHDVTTNLVDPPVFHVIPPRVYNPLIVPDRDRADLKDLAPLDRWRIYHQEAYGDLKSVETAKDPAAALEAALTAARAMGWDIVDVDRDRGTIEATATTFWYGFEDDIAIRVRANDAGSAIDIRSVSRVGVSDLGANAVRIREWLEKLEGELGQSQ